MVDFAFVKLSCGEVASEYALAAALSVRVILDFDVARKIARAYEEKLVESYMRVAFFVPTHREYLRGGTPSEPLLAEAAAQVLNARNSLDREAPDLLAKLFEQGLLARGERGEMVGRLLWTIAHDRVVQRLSLLEGYNSSTVKYHRPILLLDWLKELIHPNWHLVVLKATPVADPDGLTLEDAFKDVYVNFSHFVRAGDDDMIGPDYLWMGLVRHMAFQCADNQKSTDIAAPAHHGGLEAPIGPANTGPVFGQIKNCAMSGDVLLDSHASVGGAPHNNLPTLSFVHDLGLKKPNVYPHLRQGSPRTEDIHIRHYQIYIEGSTHETYGVVHPSTSTLYESILDATKVDEEYARKESEEGRNALLRLKPTFFTTAPALLSWVEDKQEGSSTGLTRESQPKEKKRKVIKKGEGSSTGGGKVKAKKRRR
jgi:hypothetical protein